MRTLLIAAALLLAAGPALAAESLSAAIARIESGWAQANYAEANKAQKLEILDRLIASAGELARQAPTRAEPIVWQGVLMSTKAGVVRGYQGFALVLDAKRTLERATTIAPEAAGGLGLVQLGILYAQVPGPPIAYGDRKKARAYLERALALDPHNLAANLAYGDFLFQTGKFAEAEPVLQAAVQAPVRADQRLADQGQHAEAAALLKTVRARLGKA